LKQTSQRRSSDDEADYEQSLLGLHNKQCEQRLAIWRGSDDDASSDDTEEEVSLVVNNITLGSQVS